MTDERESLEDVLLKYRNPKQDDAWLERFKRTAPAKKYGRAKTEHEEALDRELSRK
jgi:hypothetical protein